MTDKIDPLQVLGIVDRLRIYAARPGSASDLANDAIAEIERLQQIKGNAIVGLRGVNILDANNVAIRHAFQMLIGEKWIDVPVENVWETADD